MAGKKGAGYKLYSPEELEKYFEVYRTAPIAATTGIPSVREICKRTKLAPNTVVRLRDENKWESRRLRILEQVKKKADAKRVRKDVNKVVVYENLEKAGLNFQVSKVYNQDGQSMSDLKVTDIISIGKHVEYLQGNATDRHDLNVNGKPVRVVINLGDNGKRRRNGVSGS